MAVDRDKILQAAQKLVEKKRFDKAVVEYQKLVAEDPKDVRTLLKIGDLYLKMEAYADAITTYERVGQFYSAQGFGVKAIAVYKQIREIVHKHVPHMEDRFGHIVPRLAEIYTQLGLTSDALAAYDEVATRFQRAGRDLDAIDVFRKIVDLDPQNPLPYLRLGEAFVRVRDTDNAIQRFGAAAEILLKLGRREDALKVVERLLQHRQDPKFARIAAEIYLERGQPNDGMASLTKLQIAFKDNPKDLETLALLARAFDKLGQPSKSIEVQKEAARIARDANKPDVFKALVQSLLSRAPADEGVKQLAALARSIAPPAASIAPASSLPPQSIEPEPESEASPDELEELEAAQSASTTGAPMGRGSMASIEVDSDVDVVLEDDDVEGASSEAPFALRPSYGNIDLHTATSSGGLEEPAARARRILSQVELFRRGKDYDAAVAMLVEAIEELPGAGDLRSRLCDLLVEAGDNSEAVRQMLGYARWLATQSDDAEGAARVLDEALLLEPNHPGALAMLEELGYAVQSQYPGEQQYEEQQAYEEPPQQQPRPQQGPGYDPHAPLPSYDLEEVSAVDALATAPPSRAAGGRHAAPPVTMGGPRPPQPPLPQDLDDPFAVETPLPSFALEDEATRFLQVPNIDAPPPSRAESPPSRRSRAPALENIPQPTPSRPPHSSQQLDEEALEEVEFYASHGMFDDARSILDEQLSRMPNHPLLRERKRELEAMASGLGTGSGARAVSRTDEPGPDRSFDIAASLDALDALETQAPVHGLMEADPNQVSAESVFEQFKTAVAATVSPGDAQTHYDLGLAYRDMGLYADAINEFDLAARDPERECVCLSMIGGIHLQLGNPGGAIDAFFRGLHTSYKTLEQELQLRYEIGDCYEQQGANDHALVYFRTVAQLDPGYDDPRGNISQRIQRLEPHIRPMSPARAVGDDVSDEFDRALDDLIGGSKLP